MSYILRFHNILKNERFVYLAGLLVCLVVGISDDVRMIKIIIFIKPIRELRDKLLLENTTINIKCKNTITCNLICKTLSYCVCTLQIIHIICMYTYMCVRIFLRTRILLYK